MTATERILAHFDRVSEAPDAIPRLRRFILDLAVRGKLVEQHPSDEPAAELLKQITRDKATLGGSGDARVSRLTGAAGPIGLPFELRPSWQVVTLGQVLVELQTGPFGSSLHQSDYELGGVPVVNPASIQDERIVPIDKMAVGRATLERLSSFKLRAGDVVMGRRGEMGRCALVTSREAGWLCGTGSLILRLPQGVYGRFVVLLMRSPTVREYLAGTAVGATMQNLNQGILLNLPFGLPPRAEQHRIVAKVDELMALCDRFEAAQKKRESRRDRLVTASLARLSEPADLQALRDYTRFHLRHLPRMTVGPTQIQQLRRTILGWAVRGRLEPQNPEDQSAADWLATGGQSREIAAGEPPTQPFALPQGWVWRRVGDVFEVAGGIQKTPQRAPRSHAYPYLGVGNVYRGRLDLGNVKSFELQPGELQRRRLESGDILIIEGNGSLGEIGRCAKWNGEIHDCVHQNHVIRCRPVDVAISDFVLLFLNSPDGVETMQRLAITSSGLYSLSVGKIRQIAIPIPPRGEQSRIVTKVKELMTVCERLEAQLEAAQCARGALLNANLRDALSHPEPAPGIGA